MRTSFQVHEVSGEHRKVHTSRLSIGGRTSFLASWQTEFGWFEGEASPLPGYGVDSPDAAAQALRRVSPAWLEARLDELREAGPRGYLAVLEGQLGVVGSPSARFAIEQCLLGAWSSCLGRPIWSLLAEVADRDPGQVPESLATSALLDPLGEDPARAVQEALLLGVTTLKVKLGRDLERECAALRSLAPFPGNLRLDPNLAFTQQGLGRALEALGSTQVEYVEDPAADLSSWKALARLAALAVDEPLGGAAPSQAFLEALGVQFVVLKPMALGGFSVCLRWAQVAASLGISVVVSHLLDGPRALAAAFQLAFAVQSPELAAGLGPHPGLDAWPEPWRLPAGRVQRAALAFPGASRA